MVTSNPDFEAARAARAAEDRDFIARNKERLAALQASRRGGDGDGDGATAAVDAAAAALTSAGTEAGDGTGSRRTSAMGSVTVSRRGGSAAGTSEANDDDDDEDAPVYMYSGERTSWPCACVL
jgi:hypothetical protein